MESLNATEQDVRECMAGAWGILPAAIPENARLNGFAQWDSMGHVSMLLALEERFGVEVNYKTISQLTSVSAILHYLRDNTGP